MGLEKADGKRVWAAGTEALRLMDRPWREDDSTLLVGVLQGIDIDRAAVGMPGQLGLFVFPRLLTEMKPDAVVGDHRSIVIPGIGRDRGHAANWKTLIKERYENLFHRVAQCLMDDELTTMLGPDKVAVWEHEDYLLGDDPPNFCFRPMEIQLFRNGTSHLFREMVQSFCLPTQRWIHDCLLVNELTSP